MDDTKRRALHQIRERITKAFNVCTEADRQIAMIQQNIEAATQAAASNESIANALPALQALATYNIGLWNAHKASFNSQFDDILPPE